MKISRKHKAIVLRLRDPNKVLSCIPSAKTLEHKGRTFVVVPHRTPEARVLRNLGFDVPAPVSFYYGWSGRYQPMQSQRETVECLTMHPRAYCLDDLGTGKTLSTLWSYDFLRSERTVERMLVVSPLSTLERVWADEVFQHFFHLRVKVLHGSRKERVRRLQEPADIYVINHDGVKVIADELTAAAFDVICIDELSQAARNASTDRWKHLKRITDGVGYVWGLTGTPIPNAPTDAWAQCRLITPETVPQFFTHWRNKVMVQLNQWKWVPQPNALDTVHAAMQPSVRHKRDDCVDLPPVVYETRSAAMTKEQARLYKDMEDSMYARAAQGEITAVNAAVKAGKLVQIAAGAAYGPDGKPVIIKPTARIQETLDLIAGSNSKAIVYVPFVSMLHMIAEEIHKHHATRTVYGATKASERNEIFADFQQRADPHVLVAHPATMSHGLTLTAASLVIWFAPPTSAETYEQANGRITRPSQQHSQLIAHLEGSEVERRLYQALRTKTKLQNALLDMFRREETNA